MCSVEVFICREFSQQKWLYMLQCRREQRTTYALAALLLGRPPSVSSGVPGDDGASSGAAILPMGVLVACGADLRLFTAAFGVAGAALGVLGEVSAGCFLRRLPVDQA